MLKVMYFRSSRLWPGLIRPVLAVFSFVAMLALSSPTYADVPSAYVFPEGDLDFGVMAVFGSGTRTITPSGSVTESGIVSASGDFPAPARFSVGYDRGNEGNKSINVIFLVTFGAVPPVTQGGVTGIVSNLTSDLPGALTITAGQTVQVSINNCRTRQCGVTFNVGGRIDVTSLYGGADLSTPVPVSVTVVSVI